MGKPHGCVHLEELKHDLHGYTTHQCLCNNLEHGHVTRACPCEPKFSSIRKRLVFRGFRHS
ncbi:hypothetical protein F383_37961 [Gossypium arboreum]|uniref:Uncharacterized protein n=1 Tax=Gossypium arboreum TaxID=29729 RepID=A0A0B0MDQ3_GOSAR|nr:hypothetical protein F383_37961 [Gossypium arboreum]